MIYHKCDNMFLCFIIILILCFIIKMILIFYYKRINIFCYIMINRKSDFTSFIFWGVCFCIQLYLLDNAII